MPARYLASGVNHHHQRRTDRERGDDARACANYRAANCQNQEERSDEFGDILVHTSVLTRRSLKKARLISNETLVLSRCDNAESIGRCRSAISICRRLIHAGWTGGRRPLRFEQTWEPQFEFAGRR